MVLPSLAMLPAPVPMLWRAYEAPLLGFAASLVLVLAGRTRAAPWATGVAAAAGMLFGWAWRLDRPFRLAAFGHSLSASAGTAQHLVLVAAAALGAGLLAGRGRGRWLAAAAAVLVGWWMARGPAAGAQFWRAWLAGSLLMVLLLAATGRAGDAKRLAAVPLALATGLLAVRAPVPWPDVALVGAGAVLPLLATEGAAPLPLAMVGTAMAMGADLSAGRLARGGFGAVDLACLLALAAPWLVAATARRLGRAERAAPVVVAVVAGAVAWVGRLALIHR